MKKLAYTAFVAFWASVATLLSLALLAPDSPTTIEAGRSIFSLEEVSRHADERSCWMAIEGQVYDLTDYLPRHPAPSAVMLSWCGREATVGMRTKGYGPNHSDAAWVMLSEYLIGRLDQ